MKKSNQATDEIVVFGTGERNASKSDIEETKNRFNRDCDDQCPREFHSSVHSSLPDTVAAIKMLDFHILVNWPQPLQRFIRRETVKVVKESCAHFYTPLKQGVNEIEQKVIISGVARSALVRFCLHRKS